MSTCAVAAFDCASKTGSPSLSTANARSMSACVSNSAISRSSDSARSCASSSLNRIATSRAICCLGVSPPSQRRGDELVLGEAQRQIERMAEADGRPAGHFAVAVDELLGERAERLLEPALIGRHERELALEVFVQRRGVTQGKGAQNRDAIGKIPVERADRAARPLGDQIGGDALDADVVGGFRSGIDERTHSRRAACADGLCS